MNLTADYRVKRTVWETADNAGLFCLTLLLFTPLAGIHWFCAWWPQQLFYLRRRLISHRDWSHLCGSLNDLISHFVGTMQLSPVWLSLEMCLRRTMLWSEHKRALIDAEFTSEVNCLPANYPDGWFAPSKLMWWLMLLMIRIYSVQSNCYHFYLLSHKYICWKCSGLYNSF